MPRSRSSSPKRPQVEPVSEPKQANAVQEATAVVQKWLTKDEFVEQVRTWLGEPKRWKDCWYSGVMNWGSFFRRVMDIVEPSKFTYAHFVVALAIQAERHQYGAYELQFAVDPIIMKKNKEDEKLAEDFWSELPSLLDKHKFHRSFWFELSERCQTRRSFIRQDGDNYRMEYNNPVVDYNNRYYFGNGVHTTLDPKTAEICELSQQSRFNYPKEQSDDTECQNALELATHQLLRILPELIRFGPVTLPTVNGKNPISEKIAPIAEKYRLEFNSETHTFL